MMENSSITTSSYNRCIMTQPSSLIHSIFTIITVVFFLPVFIFIIYYGLKKRCKDHSNSSSSTASHSDCFTYHLVIMELVGVTGCIIVFAGTYSKKIKAVKVGTTLFSFTWYGQGFFHILTCVEHYLAVVHPITYLTLKEKRMLRVRNIIIGFVWLLSFVGMGLSVEENYIIMDSCLIILTVTVTPFCSLSVLCVLKRSGRGEQGTWKEHVDQSKQRAFYTIMAILLVLLLRFAWSMVWIVNTVHGNINCVAITCELLFNLPSSMVLPLLFLQRAGKLVCSKNVDENEESIREMVNKKGKVLMPQ